MGTKQEKLLHAEDDPTNESRNCPPGEYDGNAMRLSCTPLKHIGMSLQLLVCALGLCVELVC